ncbi:hypothetical protein KY332_02680 [Candidatus Woesearchaeota archaeon]|nr:hypothetical protein [Candidatus Woesearchaeota archaeon]
MVKKIFFKDPIRGNQVVSGKRLISASRNLVDRILDLESDEALVIQRDRDIIPGEYSDSKKFMKHGKEVKPKRTYTLREMVKQRKIPVKIREEAFETIKNPYFCGYSFVPAGRDKVKRKVSLVACLEGNRIYCYAHQVRFTGIDVGQYDDARRVEIEGATVPVRVPSRTKGQRKHEFNLNSVAIEDTPDKYSIAYEIESEGHLCKHKQYMFRYRPKRGHEKSKIINICPHEIAAYMEAVDMYWNEDKNIIPLQMSQFVVPTQFFVDQYKKICRQIAFEKDGNLKVPNFAQKEILLWAIVQREGHDKTCFASEGTKVRRYNWS